MLIPAFVRESTLYLTDRTKNECYNWPLPPVVSLVRYSFGVWVHSPHQIQDALRHYFTINVHSECVWLRNWCCFLLKYNIRGVCPCQTSVQHRPDFSSLFLTPAFQAWAAWPLPSHFWRDVITQGGNKNKTQTDCLLNHVNIANFIQSTQLHARQHQHQLQ